MTEASRVLAEIQRLYRQLRACTEHTHAETHSTACQDLMRQIRALTDRYRTLTETRADD